MPKMKNIEEDLNNFPIKNGNKIPEKRETSKKILKPSRNIQKCVILLPKLKECDAKC